MAIVKLIIIPFLLSTAWSKQEFSQRVTNFSLELLYFTGIETDAHTVVSPFGVWTLMTALAQGTTGKSYEQLRRALNLPKGRKELLGGFKAISQQVHKKSDGINLLEYNFIFPDRSFPLNPNFRQSLMGNFNAVVLPLDFTSPQESSSRVNGIISKATNGQISEALIPDDFQDAKVILTNVIHFKGLWKNPFNASETQIQPFYDEHGKKIGDVNMMIQRAPFPFTNMRSLSSYVLEVPYGEENGFSMLLILPYLGTNLLDMYKNFQTVTLKDIFESIDRDQEMFGEEDVDLSLPKFKITTDLVLNKPLNDMGVYDIFDPELASFDGLTSEKVFVSKVVHKAVIEVTEEGTTASAVTSSVLSDRIPPVDFKVNRPFVYLIVEKVTSTVVFGGIFSKPSVF